VRNARRKQRADVQTQMLVAPAPNSSNLNYYLPADGTSAAAEGNGDFGRSPIFGQLSDKLLLVLCAFMLGCRT